MSLNSIIRWEFEGSGLHKYQIEITSVDTGRTGLFVEYEVDFTGDVPIKRQLQMNDRAFSQLSSPGDDTTSTGSNDDDGDYYSDEGG
jgi:hypothetical protein